MTWKRCGSGVEVMGNYVPKFQNPMIPRKQGYNRNTPPRRAARNTGPLASAGCRDAEDGGDNRRNPAQTKGMPESLSKVAGKRCVPHGHDSRP